MLGIRCAAAAAAAYAIAYISVAAYAAYAQKRTMTESDTSQVCYARRNENNFYLYFRVFFLLCFLSLYVNRTATIFSHTEYFCNGIRMLSLFMKQLYC